MPQTLQEHILAVTGIRLRGTDRQKQLRQMIDAVGKLNDDDWVKLKPAAQHWYEAAFGDKEKLDKSEEIPDFQADAKSEKEDTVATKTKSNGKRKVKVAKAGKHPGAPVVIRRLLNKNPKLSAPELHAKLVARGYDASEMFVSATRSIHIASLRELDAQGFLKDHPIQDLG